MINLPKKLKEGDGAAKTSTENAGVPFFKKSKYMRDVLLLKEVEDLQANLPPQCALHWTDPDKLEDFSLFVTPDEGHWKNGKFQFHVLVTEGYNMVPPNVCCKTKIWHPNISEEGEICLSILRQTGIDELGWTPIRQLKDVIWGLNSLFTDLTNFEEPLNTDAGGQFTSDPEEFKAKVQSYIRDFC